MKLYFTILAIILMAIFVISYNANNKKAETIEEIPVIIENDVKTQEEIVNEWCLRNPCKG